MFKLLRGRGPHVSAERQKLQKELFAFNKTVSHGFPARPTCLAYDKALNLLALGTRSGQIRVLGKPGVELESGFETETSVVQIQFVENKGRLVVLCEDSSLHLFEINEQTSENGDILEKVKSCDYFSKEQEKGSLKQVTTVLVDSTQTNLLVGTKGGNIYIVDLETLQLTDQIIYQDVVLQNVPEEQKKLSPGEVEQILEQPGAPGKYLIAFNKGLLVLWDNKNLLAEHFYVSNQQVESIDWLSSGDQFVTSHNDGSIIQWKVSDNLTPSEPAKITYGPFPCKPITKIARKTVKNQEDYVIFAGGMPRASYGEKHTISVIQGNPEKQEKHQVLDLTSKIVDFIIVDNKDEDGFDNPSTLIVLAEEELIAIDLTHPDWLQYRLPYLSCVHSSPITTCVHYSAVPSGLIKKLRESGEKQVEGKYTDKEWPVQGGSPIVGTQVDQEESDLLITGHEDGSVRFWLTGGHHFLQIYILNTSKLFYSPDDDIAPIDGDEPILDESLQNGVEWPPFRKVGTYDPFSDDARFAIRKIVLSTSRGILAVGGSAGQVIAFEILEEVVEKPLTVVTAKLIEDPTEGVTTNFVWTGHSKLNPTNGNMKFEPGFQPRSILQISPPASVISLASNSELSLLSVGTSHGFVIYDYLQINVVLAKCTLTITETTNPGGATGTLGRAVTPSSGEGAPVARRKSLKNTLRESFRRLRKPRVPVRSKSSEHTNSSAPSSPSPSPSKQTTEEPKSPSKSEDATAVAAAPAEGADTTLEIAEEAKETKDAVTVAPTATAEITEPAPEPEKVESKPATPSPSPAPVASPEKKSRTLERLPAPEPSKPEEDTKAVVRCVYFGKAPLASGTSPTPTLWVGTNSGLVYVYALQVASEEKRETTPVTCQLSKEIHLKHGAPVVFIQILDSTGHPVPSEEPPKVVEPTVVEAEEPKPEESEKKPETEDKKDEESSETKTEAESKPEPKPETKSEKPSASSPNPSRVLICSEEQFKLFNLPSLKSNIKFKLTSGDSTTRVRQIGLASFVSKSNPKHVESCVLCLTNHGDVLITTAIDLKKQLQTNCTKKDDQTGLNSLVFTSKGEGFYLHSPSELKHFSTAAARLVKFVCHIELPEGCRPPKEVQQPPIAAATLEQPATTATGEEEKKTEADEKKAEEVKPVESKSKLEEKPSLDKKMDEVQEQAKIESVEPVQVNGVHHQNSNEEDLDDLKKAVSGKISEAIPTENGKESPEKVKNIINGNSLDKETNDLLDGVHDLSIVSTESMDMTIDSIKDHMITTTEVISTEVVKKTTKTVDTLETTTTPVINSHED